MPPFLSSGLKAEAEKCSTKAMVSTCEPMEAWPTPGGTRMTSSTSRWKFSLPRQHSCRPVKQDVELIFVFVPVITVVEHIVDKAADGEIFPGPVQLIICKFHPSSSQNPNIFPVEKV